MSNQRRWWLTGALLTMIVTTAVLSEPTEALGCWRRGGLFGMRRTCEPIVVEVIPQAPAKVVVKDPPKEVVKEPPLPAVEGDLRVNVKYLAALLKDGNTVAATRYAHAVAVKIDEFADLEHLYRARNKGGLGWGGKTVKPNPAVDSLERGLLEFASKISDRDARYYEINVEAGYFIAAMAELTIAKAPKKDLGAGRSRKFWVELATAQRSAGLDFAYAAAKSDVN